MTAEELRALVDSTCGGLDALEAEFSRLGRDVDTGPGGFVLAGVLFARADEARGVAANLRALINRLEGLSLR